VVRDDGVEAIRGQQPLLAGLGRVRSQIQFRAGIHIAENPHQHIAVRMHLRLFGPQPALIDQPLDEGVVDADLFEGAVLQPVGARVPDVRELEPVIVEQQRRDRGAHAGQLGAGLHQLGEDGVGGLDFVGEDVGGVLVVAAVQMDQVQDRGSGGDIAACVSAHAIRHNSEIVPGVGGIVILGTGLAYIRPRRVAQDQRHGYGLNSMTVLPIRMGAPGSTGRARVSCVSPK
jgi:hypothetical protein